MLGTGGEMLKSLVDVRFRLFFGIFGRKGTLEASPTLLASIIYVIVILYKIVVDFFTYEILL